MKAIVMTAVGGPEVLQLRDVLDPVRTSDTEMLVRLRAAGINPVDTKLRSKGTFHPERMPAILGCDGAGVVEEVGPGVRRFKRGDEVYFCHGGIGGHPGNYAEYALVDEAFAARKPASLSFAEAAAAPLVLITAWESLRDRGRLTPGQRALIHAGAGGVGHVAVQLARTIGADVATTVGSAAKAQLAGDLGAHLAILYKQRNFVEQVLEWSGGEGVDVALDTVGGAIFQETFGAVKVYGDIVTLLQPAPEVNWGQARLRNLRIGLELMLTPMYYGLTEAQRHQAHILEECAGLFDEGKLTIHLQSTFPLSEAAAAHRMIEAGSMTGKLALTME